MNVSLFVILVLFATSGLGSCRDILLSANATLSDGLPLVNALQGGSCSGASVSFNLFAVLVLRLVFRPLVTKRLCPFTSWLLLPIRH